MYANIAVQGRLDSRLDDIIGRRCHAVTHLSNARCDSLSGTACPVNEAFRSGARAAATHKHLHDSRLVVEEIVAAPPAGTELVIEELRDLSHLLGLVDGILPICSSCKRIRDENGDGKQIEG